MKLDQSSPVPLYLQLQEILRTQIGTKLYKPGSKLPSENELCRNYSVTRPTVRQALEGLVREGLLYKHRGKGAFVTTPPLPIGLFSITGTIDAFAEQKLKVETKVLRIGPVSKCVVAEGNDPSQGWVGIERVRNVNGIATIFEYTWITSMLVPGLASVDLNNQSLYHTLNDKYGLRIEGGRQRFSAVSAPLEVAQALQVRAGVPLLRVVRSMDLVQYRDPASIILPERVSGGLRVDLYVAQGPFVLEQAIPSNVNSLHEVTA